MGGSSSSTGKQPRLITSEQITKHNESISNTNNKNKNFWGVVDGYVVDATEFIKRHPGGLKKLLSTNESSVGATGRSFGFSFARGRNKHYQQTAAAFQKGLQDFLSDNGCYNYNYDYYNNINNDTMSIDDDYLAPMEIHFSTHGKIIILGKFVK